MKLTKYSVCGGHRHFIFKFTAFEDY